MQILEPVVIISGEMNLNNEISIGKTFYLMEF